MAGRAREGWAQPPANAPQAVGPAGGFWGERREVGGPAGLEAQVAPHWAGIPCPSAGRRVPSFHSLESPGSFWHILNKDAPFVFVRGRAPPPGAQSV